MGKSEAASGEFVSTDSQFPIPDSRLPILVLDGRSHAAMIAADAILLASGTAALEAMLAKRPMVVAYRLAALTYRIVKGFGLLKVERYSLPNHLAGREIVPELMQERCTPQALAESLAQTLAGASNRTRAAGRIRALASDAARRWQSQRSNGRD